MTLKKKAFEITVGKRENADNQHFLLFLQSFLPHQGQVLSFRPPLICCLGNCFEFERV